MQRPRPLRVLHCPELMGGNPSSLARAERAIGIDSRVVALRPSPLDYGADEVLARSGASPVATEAQRLRLLAKAISWADVVHFNFGSSVMPSRWTYAVAEADSPWLRRIAAQLYTWLFEGRDLPLLRARGKGIAVTFQGSDARPARLTPGWERPPAMTARVDRMKRRAIERFDRHADLIYALNPDLLAHLPERARFCPYANVWLADLEPVDAPAERRMPVIAHAPTRRELKGTDALLAASERLRADGVEHELRLIEGMANDGARAMLAEADVVVDQLRLGWYGGVAVEAMALAKPVVGNLGAEDLAAIPAAMREQLPLVPAGEETVEGALRDLLTGPAERRHELGLEGREYVEHWHDPVAIARRLASDYESVIRRRGAPRT